MAYKHIETIATYQISGRGTILVTLDRTVKAGEIIEVGGKTWKVIGVEVSETQPHAGLQVVPFSESDAKRATAQDAKNLLQAIFAPMLEATPEPPGDMHPAAEIVLQNPVAGMITPPLPQRPQPQPRQAASEEQKLKLVNVLQELDTHMMAVRDWILNRLGEFDLGKDPPAVLVMVVTMPKEGLANYVQQLEPFLVQSLEQMEKEGKVGWANIKAVTGTKK